MMFLNGEVNTEYAGEVMRDLQEIAFMPDHERPSEIIYFIHSPGGCLSSSFQIIDAIRQMPIPVVTYGMGYVASGALLILMAGHTRVVTSNTMLMSHQFATGSEGKHHELVADRVGIENANELMLAHYRRSTKKSVAYIRKHLLPAHDVVLKPEQALQHGLIDDIVKIS